MPTPIKHTFNGKKYQIKRMPAEDMVKYLGCDDGEIIYGYCDHPETRNRTIGISDEFKGKPLLKLELHEFLHASLFRLSEKQVIRMSEELSEILWKLGYRKTK